MKALLVGASPGVTAAEVARAAAERGVLRVAVDGGLRRFGRGACDLWVGDGDSLGPGGARRLEAVPVVVELAADKDRSDLWHALAECAARGARKIVALGVLGGRADHELAALLDLAAWADRAGARSVEARGRGGSWFLLGARGARSLLIPRGRCFSLVDLGGARLRLTGAEYRLVGRLGAGSHGLSNRAVGASGARVSASAGRAAVWVAGPTRR